MRVFRNILLFIASLFVADLVIGLAIDAAVIAWFGDLSATTEQALLVVKYLAYLAAAIVVTVKLDAAFQKRATGSSQPAASNESAGSTSDETTQSEDSTPAVAAASTFVPTPAERTLPADAGETRLTHEEQATGASQSMRPPRRIPKPAVILSALGVLALGIGIGVVLARNGGHEPGGLTGVTASSPSPSASSLRGLIAGASSDGLSVDPRKLRVASEQVLAMTERLASNDHAYWISPDGRTELRGMRKTLEPIRVATALLSYGGDLTRREARLVKATVSYAMALDEVMRALLKDDVTQTQLHRLQTTYVRASEELKSF